VALQRHYLRGFDDVGFLCSTGSEGLCVFRHNVAALCQLRSTAWVTACASQSKPQRGDP
jgi:hypothetical protein